MADFISLSTSHSTSNLTLLETKMASTPMLLPHAFDKGFSTNHKKIPKAQFQCLLMRGSENGGNGKEVVLMKRRELIGSGLGASAGFLMGLSIAQAAGLPPEEKPRLCDDACLKELENVW